MYEWTLTNCVVWSFLNCFSETHTNFLGVVFNKISNIRVVLFDIITVCVFQMVIHDVLIIGSGPHALTLASLLCSNDWDPKSDVRHDSLFSTSTTKSQPSTETLSNKPNTSKMKRKKRVTDGMVCLSLLSQNWEDVRIVTENLSVHRETFSGN